MNNPELQLARIKSTTLGREDHGMLSSFLHLEYAKVGEKVGSSGQGFGGYVLTGDYANMWLEGVLDAVGVGDWKDLPGKWVWATTTHMKVLTITGVTTGVTFDPTKWANNE
jgi:hypothetical protein